MADTNDQHLPFPQPPAHDAEQFVLSASCPYVRNLAALWATDPDLARRLEKLDQDAASHDLATACAPTEPDDSGFAVLFEKIDPQEHFAFHVHGFGPHLLRLFHQLGGEKSEAVFAVFEPSLSQLRDAFILTDYIKLLRSRRLLILTQIDASIFDRLGPFSSLINLGFVGLRHEPSIRRDPAFFAQAAARVADFVSLSRTNLATTIQHGRKTARNLCDNLQPYLHSGSLARLKDAFLGRPAIIVSAGPSLRKNIDQLHRAQGKAIIIAVQTTLRPLLEAGVTPDFVTALDHHEISSRFYENLPHGLTTELVAEPKTSRKVLQAWQQDPGRRLTLLGNAFLESILREARPAKPTLPAGATVAHLAFSLAEYLGCGAAILVGQDLGFSDGLAYTPGTSYDDVWRPETGRFCTFEMRQWEHIARDRPALRPIQDWRGNSTYTEQRLFTYLQQFERMFAASAMAVIDATEGGVAKRHTTRMTLSEAVASFCASPLPALPKFKATGFDPRLTAAAAIAVERRVEEACQIARISAQTLHLLQQLETDLTLPGGGNHTIGRLDGLRAELRQYDETYGLLLSLTQSSELEKFRADRQIHAATLAGGTSARARQKLQLKRDQINVCAIEEAARELALALEAALASLGEGPAESKAA